MTVYNTGSVNLKIGSSEVVGNDTEFTTYIVRGYLFKRTSDSAIYEVAAVNSATNLELTARYLDSNYYSEKVSEVLATVDSATRMYSGTLNYNPVIQSSISLNASGAFTDNGAGALTGYASGTGTIDYDTGAWTITLGTTLHGTYDMTATYNSGNNLNGVPYQLVVDYTPHREFPEISTSDLNFAHIYTKGIRMVDAAFMKEKVKITSVSYTATDTDKVVIASNNTTKIRITLPPSSTNVGRKLEMFNLSSSPMIATPYATPTKINDTTSTLITSRFDSRQFLCASSNLWIRIF